MAGAYGPYRGTCESGSSPRSSNDIKQKLLGALQEIEFAGSFAFSISSVNLPDPTLRIDGIPGVIALPLSVTTARKLIRQARQAPYGKGSETIVDTAVRNTWELDAAQFSFNNPQWERFISRICKSAAEELGVGVPVSAEIYKMLFYEKGAMFKAHTDTEKIPGMFGTLVIALPSAHEGGDLILKHAGSKQVFRSSIEQPSFCCWYSDVSHEVLPVESGYRWVLTYNLAIDPEHPRPTAELHQPQLDALNQALRSWLSKGATARPNPWLYHVLDHEYTQAQISIRMLKGKDRDMIRTLQSACNDKPLEIFFAFLEKREMGSCWVDYDNPRRSRGGKRGFHEITEVEERKYSVKQLVDLKGQIVMENLKLNEGDVLKDGCFEHLKAEEEYQGYMGNSGPTATHWYRTTAIILLPRDSLFTYFQEGNTDYRCDKSNTRKITRYVAQRCLEPDIADSMLPALMELCSYAWRPESHSHNRLLDADTIFDVMKFAVMTCRIELFEHAAKNHRGALPSKFFAWLKSYLTSSENIRPQWIPLKAGTMSSFLHFSSFNEMLGSLNTLAPITLQSQEVTIDSPECVLGTIQSHLSRLVHTYLNVDRPLDGSSCLSNKDGEAMVNLAMYHNDPFVFLTTILIPKILTRLDTPAFVLGLLSKLHSLNSTFFNGETQPFCSDLAHQFLSNTNFAGLRSLQLTQTTQHVYNHQAPVPQKVDISFSDLNRFLSYIHELSSGSGKLLELFVSRVAASAPQFQRQELQVLWIPLLQSAMKASHHKTSSATLKQYQLLFTALLEAYVSNYIGPKPDRPERELPREGVICYCDDCERLNEFFNNATNGVGCSTVGKPRRYFLHKHLEAAKDGHSGKWGRGRAQIRVTHKTVQYLEEEQKEWEKRMELARTSIMQFDQAELKILLGDKYQAITRSAGLRQTDATHFRTSLGQTSTNPPQSGGSSQSNETARRKRKRSAEQKMIIDLTSD